MRLCHVSAFIPALRCPGSETEGDRVIVPVLLPADLHYQVNFLGLWVYINALVRLVRTLLSSIAGITWSQGFLKSGHTKARPKIVVTKQNSQELLDLGKLPPEFLGQKSWTTCFEFNHKYLDLIWFDLIWFDLISCIIISVNLRLRSRISSYLDVPGLCAERATARKSYSRKASTALCWAFCLCLAVAQAFVSQLMELCRPDTSLTQMGNCKR